MLAKSKHCYFNYICYEAVQVCLVPTCRLWAVPRSEHDPGDNRELLQVAAPLPSAVAVCCSAFPVQTILRYVICIRACLLLVPSPPEVP